MARGLTLVELAVVLLVLGVLAAVAVPRFLDLQEEAKRAQRQEVLRHLRRPKQDRAHVEPAQRPHGEPHGPSALLLLPFGQDRGLLGPQPKRFLQRRGAACLPLRRRGLHRLSHRRKFHHRDRAHPLPPSSSRYPRLR